MHGREGGVRKGAEEGCCDGRDEGGIKQEVQEEKNKGSGNRE